MKEHLFYFTMRRISPSRICSNRLSESVREGIKPVLLNLMPMVGIAQRQYQDEVEIISTAHNYVRNEKFLIDLYFSKIFNIEENLFSSSLNINTFASTSLQIPLQAPHYIERQNFFC